MTVALSTMLPHNSTTNDSHRHQHIGVNNMTIGDALTATLLFTFVAITIGGNSLVIYAVMRMRYLRSITNYFIVSLAVADLLMGSVVMPFQAINTVRHPYWPYGQHWCDLWHAFDVLSSTASILNLCMIAIERFWATQDPINYPIKMTSYKVSFMIFLVWFLSSIISFPAVSWWRAVKPSVHSEDSCTFTDDALYLVTSSIVSFYMPLIVMVVVYYRIYRTAVTVVRTMNSGEVVCRGHHSSEQLTLRVHRGKREITNTFHSNMNDSATVKLMRNDDNRDNTAQPGKLYRFIRKRLVSEKWNKFAREQKAAKTLGIVMGIFVMCWLPFFVFSLLSTIHPKMFGDHAVTIFAVVTWLGYINSCVNPFIYAQSMKDFRRAFFKILCPRMSRSQSIDAMRFNIQARQTTTCKEFSTHIIL